jgi:hypothetical protein
VFPWNAAAKPGEPFTAGHLRAGQTSGRFDLNDRPPVHYLAESPVHAVAEKLQRYRGRTIGSAHLDEWGHPLALVAVTVPEEIRAAVADLTDPATLVRLGIGPDRIASGSRSVTQAIARQVHGAGHTGLRWWSALDGDWHAVVLFGDAVPEGKLEYGVPERLTLEHLTVREAAMRLGVTLGRRGRRPS